MALKHLMIPLLLLGCLPVQARDYTQAGGTQQTSCYETVYREEYVPGTRNNPGYVRRWTEKKKVPCKNRNRGHRGSHQHPPAQTNHNHGPVDDNSCIEGAVLGLSLIHI